MSVWKIKFKKLFISFFLKINFLNKREKWNKQRNKYKSQIKSLKLRATSGKKSYVQPTKDSSFNPFISIIVPNYNYASFLKQRLESIYNQSYQNFEVILLDDASTDNSVDIFIEYKKKFPEKTKLIVNKENAGTAFRAWAKGIAEAKGDLIWIAEADDYCDLNFLKELTYYFQDEIIMLAFCYSSFVDEKGKEFMTIIDYVGEKFALNFIESSSDLMRNIFAYNNIIPNVSSCIFRNIKDNKLLGNKNWLSMKYSGDWMFYAEIIRGGFLAYTVKTRNYFRRHKNSTATADRTKCFYQELEMSLKHIVSNYTVFPYILEKCKTFLENKFYLHFPKVENNFEDIFSIERIKLHSRKKFNILIANYAFTSGGAEAMAIFLANEYKRQGFNVTFLDYMNAPTNISVKNMLIPGIPLIKTQDVNLISYYLQSLDIKIVQTVNALINLLFVKVKKVYPNFYLVSGLHGDHEAVPIKTNIELFDLSNIVPYTDKFIYISVKNLLRFKELGLYEPTKFVRISNGLPFKEINPIEKSTINIPKNSFVLCLVSRAIPEKGWVEAIKVVEYINSQKPSREAHLILIGDGIEYERLKNTDLPQFIHLLGYKNNIRDYFAACDFGFLPSKFKGECFGLVNVDCLLSGKPIIVSDNIPEIKELFSVKDKFAGFVFEIENNMIPVKKIGDRIIHYIEDKESYDKLLPIVKSLQGKFSIKEVANQYINEYKNLIESKKKRVLLVSHEFSLSGSPMVALLAAKVLKENGIEVTLASPVSGLLEAQIQSLGIDSKVIDTYNITHYYGYDLIIFFAALQYSAVLFVQSSLPRVPILFWMNEGDVLIAEYSKDTLKDIHSNIICGGTYCFDRVKKVKEDGIIKILNYGLEDKAKETKKEYLKSEKLIFTIFGNIQPRKRQTDFIKAIAMLDNSLKEKCEFRIIGSSIEGYKPSEQEFKEIRTLIAYIPEIKLIPKVLPDELSKYYESTDVSVCASNDDPMPIVITESLMYGKAVIVSENTGQVEFIKDGINGFIFETYNILELSKKIKYLIENPEIIYQIGKEGRKIYEEHFTDDIFKNNFLSIVKEVL